MADLLQLPEASQKNKYCLVVVDIATNKFDLEPLKNKESKTTLNAFKKIFKRKILTRPKVSLVRKMY